MMFASRYRLSPHDAKALRISDTYSLHRVVYGLFDDVRGGDREKGSGILFADMGGDKYGRHLLILSDRQPREPEYGEFVRTEPIPEAFFGFSAYRFEIVINPVKRDSRSKKIVCPCAAAKRSHAGFWKKPPHGVLRYRNPLFRSRRSMLMFFGRGNRKSPWEKRG